MSVPKKEDVSSIFNMFTPPSGAASDVNSQYCYISDEPKTTYRSAWCGYFVNKQPVWSIRMAEHPVPGYTSSTEIA
jgi:hypothetical protein